MAGVKRRSGGRRRGAGAKPQTTWKARREAQPGGSTRIPITLSNELGAFIECSEIGGEDETLSTTEKIVRILEHWRIQKLIV